MLEFKNCEECENIEVAKPFVLKTHELLKNEFSLKILSVEIVQIKESINIHNINFMSTLTGAIDANLLFSFQKDLAKKLLHQFPYLEYHDSIEEEMIIETVGEFLNIVIGNAMGDIHTDTRLSFSPPLGLNGNNKLFNNKNFDVCKIKFTLEEGNMMIIFSTSKKKDN